MAINVDKVYLSVLSIMNREQRGNITPAQFNRIARTAQLDILEGTFFEYNISMTKKQGRRVYDEYGNIPKMLKEKIDYHSVNTTLALSLGVANFPAAFYRTIGLTKDSRTIEIEEVSKSDFTYINSSPLTKPTEKFPVYFKAGDTINVFPNTITSVDLDYIAKPADPTWAYTIGSSGQYLYDSNNSIDFELHPSDEVSLITKILMYAGVIINDPALTQSASNEENIKYQKENS
jgi:hypothetical protein